MRPSDRELRRARQHDLHTHEGSQASALRLQVRIIRFKEKTLWYSPLLPSTPTNVYYPGPGYTFNSNRPNYGPKWSFTNPGAQNDIFVVAASKRSRVVFSTTGSEAQCEQPADADLDQVADAALLDSLLDEQESRTRVRQDD